MAGIAEVLSIPPAFAAFLLGRYKWMPSKLQDDWFSDDRRVRDAAGLPADGGAPVVATALSPRPLICAICFDRYPAGATRSASCSSHFYCDDCWRGYVGGAGGDGPRCLSLRCPDPGCSAAVIRGLVDAVAGAVDRERYARLALWSYVEESGGRIKWCPSAGCSRGVEFVGCAGYDAMDVLCKCRHGFCWSCGEEAHRPVSCGTVLAWLAKNKSDSETANWMLANTKLCPKCRRAIEKNHGCNHMSCPCGHHFCWICFQPAGTRQHYACQGDIYRPAEERRRRRGDQGGGDSAAGQGVAGQLVMPLSRDDLMTHLSTILPAALDAFENQSPYVRKAILLCLVDTYLKLGPAVAPHLERLHLVVATWASRLSRANV